MDTTTHYDTQALFAQLGLPNSPEEIHQFIAMRRPLSMSLDLTEAPFWSSSQVSFLREEWHADNGDWSIVIDQLNSSLRDHPTQEELFEACGAPNPGSRLGQP